MEPTTCNNKTSITFGMFLDGADWSDAPASIGELRLGPAGMLDYLETRLGAAGPKTAKAIRIDQYMARLEAVDGNDMWFHKSYEMDPWSTAKQLLSWRDELIETGWTGTASDKSSERLKALAILEAVKLPLSPGMEDRLQTALKLLGTATAIDNSGLELIESQEHYSPIWQKIISRLSEIGVSVGIAAKPSNDDKPPKTELIRLVANNEWEAAENLATWLGADTDGNKDIAIISGAGTGILDQALAKRGLPIIGRGNSSKWRPYLQMLPLAIANLWTPIDIPRLVDLLSLPLGFIRRSDAASLLWAISKEPGVGGDKWMAAITRTEQRYIARQLELNPEADMDKLQSDAKKYSDGIEDFLVRERYAEEKGAPAYAIEDRCHRIIRRLHGGLKENPEFGVAIGQAMTMNRLMGKKKTVSKILLERMLDSVVEAVAEEDRQAEVAPWRVYSRPEHVINPVKTLVWWGFTEPADSTLTYWTHDERAELLERGNPLELQSEIRDRTARAMQRTIEMVSDKAIFIYPKYVNGEDAVCHPLWDEIAGEKNAITLEVSGLLNEDKWEFAGRKELFEAAGLAKLEKPKPVYRIPAGTIRPRDHISASEIKTLISCPYRWALDYQAGLEVSNVIQAPNENIMMGNLCHKIAAMALPIDDFSIDTGAIKAAALLEFDSLVPKMAAELQHKSRAADHIALRETMAEAVGALAAAINSRGLAVEATERNREDTRLEKAEDDLKVVGYLDIIAKDRDGRRFAVDMKWTGSPKRYFDEISEGTSVQLATYSWLLRNQGGEYPDAGYFLLAQRQLPIDKQMPVATDLEVIWKKSMASWDKRILEIESGNLEATGLIQKEFEETGLAWAKIKGEMKEHFDAKGLLLQTPFCRYCDFGVLCGAKRAG